MGTRTWPLFVGALAFAITAPACERARVDAPADPAAASAAAPVPDHLLVLVFDQMRPDYIDRFDLPHFKAFRASARHYPDAWVGHLGSQTVVSHIVIPTGLLPKDLPWQDDVLVDQRGALGRMNAPYDVGRLSREQLFTLLEPLAPATFLPYRLRAKTGRPVFAAGEKDYATYLLGTPASEAIVTLKKRGKECEPTGVQVPVYIATRPRFRLDCSDSYGTGLTTLYALDGNRYVPGTDPDRAGGDVWTADVALEIMTREPWSGLFLTFGGIDKVAHMLGEQDGDGLRSVNSAYRLRDVAAIADAQLGRLLDGLRSHDLLERTLIVITSDHGGQRNDYYLGNNKYQSCCPLENSDATVAPPYWIEHLTQIGSLHTSYQDTSVKVWLADRDPANERAVAVGMADISGMVEVYALRQDGAAWRYERLSSTVDRQPERFRQWAARQHAALLDSMANEHAPHLVGLLADGYGFGRVGDHGGAQERVQRIPIMIRVPGEPGSVHDTPLRLADIEGEVTRIMQLPPRP